MEKNIIIGLGIAVAVLLIVVIGLAVANHKLRFGGIKIKKGRTCPLEKMRFLKKSGIIILYLRFVKT